MKRGTLLGSNPREYRKVFAAAGLSDFTSGISVVFSGCCPPTVSDSETVLFMFITFVGCRPAASS